MLMVAASVPKVLSLMESNVKLKLSINVLAFLTPIGMEPTVIASQVLPVAEPLATVKVLLWETIVKDVHQSPTRSGEMVSANVIPVMSN